MGLVVPIYSFTLFMGINFINLQLNRLTIILNNMVNMLLNILMNFLHLIHLLIMYLHI